MKILVSGANGQLGQALKSLSENHPEIDFTFTDVGELDITDFHAVEKMVLARQTDVMINCASYNAVDQAEDEPLAAMRINGNAVQGMAGLARKHGFGLVHISTDYIFDGKKGSAYTELDEPHPQSKYAHSKFIGEQAVMTSNPKGMIIRTAWLYSEYGHNFVKTIRKLAMEREEIRVVNDQHGTPTYADDLAAAIIHMLPSIPEFEGTRIYNYSSEGLTHWAEFAEAVISLSGLNCKVIPVSTQEYGLSKATRPAFSLLDTTKIKRDFDLRIPEWKESLEICIKNLEKQ